MKWMDRPSFTKMEKEVFMKWMEGKVQNHGNATEIDKM